MEYEENDLRIAARLVDCKGNFSLYHFLIPKPSDRRKSIERFEVHLEIRSKQYESINIMNNLFGVKPKPLFNHYICSIKDTKMFIVMEILLPYIKSRKILNLYKAAKEFRELHNASKLDPNKRNRNLRSRFVNKFKKLRLAEKELESQNLGQDGRLTISNDSWGYL